MSSATGDADARAAHLQTRLRGALRRVDVPRRAVGDRVRRDRRPDRRAAVRDRPVRRARHRDRVDHPRGLGDRPRRRARRAACSPPRSTRSAIRGRRSTPRSSASRSPPSLGYAVALPLREALGYSVAWGAFGLTAALGPRRVGRVSRCSAAGSPRRIGAVPTPTRLVLGALGAAIARGRRRLRRGLPRRSMLGARAWQAALVAIPVFGGVYLGVDARREGPRGAWPRGARAPALTRALPPGERWYVFGHALAVPDRGRRRVWR